MVRIIRGTFGWFDGRRVVPVTAADGPKTFDPDLERRLVAEGVAEYVDAPAAPAPEVAPKAETAPADAPDLDAMTRAQLVELAAEHGVHAGKMSKAALADAIRAAL